MQIGWKAGADVFPTPRNPIPSSAAEFDTDGQADRQQTVGLWTHLFYILQTRALWSGALGSVTHKHTPTHLQNRRKQRHTNVARSRKAVWSGRTETKQEKATFGKTSWNEQTECHLPPTQMYTTVISVHQSCTKMITNVYNYSSI